MSAHAPPYRNKVKHQNGERLGLYFGTVPVTAVSTGMGILVGGRTAASNYSSPVVRQLRDSLSGKIEGPLPNFETQQGSRVGWVCGWW